MPHVLPQTADLLIAARWVIPVEPSGAILDHHSVVVGAGKIIAVLPQSEAADRFPGVPLLHRPHHALLPGFVNAHTHAAMALFRGMADDLPLEEWLTAHIWPAESRWTSAEFVRDGTRLALLEMVRSGTTCCNDMYYFPDVVAGLAVEHRIRIAVGMILIDQPTTWAATSDEYFSKGLAVHDQYREHPLVHSVFAPHAPYSVDDHDLARVRLLADELGTPIHMHVHESAGEIAKGMASHGQRPLARLEKLGLVSPLLMAVHATHLTDEEIALLAERGASVVHCPESNLKFASGFCPVARLRRAGVNVALGTDGAASNNDLDMFGEMRTAALLAKAIAEDPRAVAAADALEMATICGARALGLADRIGSLLPGKCADMICVNLRAPATQPVHNAISQLVYSAGRDQVTDSWIAGYPVMADGVSTTLDESDILARADSWRARLMGHDD